MINIRFATIDDISKIMEFINSKWKNGHIMGNNRQLFEYQHLEDNKVRYVIGIDENDNIYGTIGYVMYNHSENPDITSMMIKTIKSSRAILGWDMKCFLEEKTKCRFHTAPGLNLRTAGVLVELSDDTVIKLNHYYRINDLEQYKIAHIENKKIQPILISDNTKLIEIKSYEQFNNIITDSLLEKGIPYKDKKYLKHRYFEHPFYKYKFFAIKIENKVLSSIIIGREIIQNDAKIFRIMDFLGNDEELRLIGKELDKLIKKNNYEYIDFYCYGIREDILKSAGFLLRNENDENIIPNYFEPFEKRNVEIYGNGGYIEGLHMYKGDGDQDRPSIIKKNV